MNFKIAIAVTGLCLLPALALAQTASPAPAPAATPPAAPVTATAPAPSAAPAASPVEAEAMKKVRQACAADAAKFCATVEKGKGQMRACLESHAAELSATCKEGLAARAANGAAKAKP
jgi:Cysteine rich repeat